jgi:hypothetical protein
MAFQTYDKASTRHLLEHMNQLLRFSVSPCLRGEQ